MTPRRVVRRIAASALIAVVLAFFAVPMLWLAGAPFDARPGLGLRWPDWTLANVRATLAHPYALTSLANSVLLCLVACAVTTSSAALAAYALSRVRLPGRDALLYLLLLLSSVVTGTAAMVPIFVLMLQLGLIDSRLGTALVLAGGLLPAAIFILKDFVDAVPRSYEESARVFGASAGQVLGHVVLPVARPGIAMVLVWSFVNAWGNFLLPFLLLRDVGRQPAAVLLRTLQDEGGSVNLAVIPVFSLLYSIPVVVLYVLVDKRYGFRFHGGIKS
ncbi:carbohydrate ABC transporter permease [Saccharothrix coeruleofusca]|uniref:Sugar ABC transporter permease n=1 Tax=Saccharothrix coeruleofusca TaxID=33919 RepID=A0A918ASD6_9PSEU|nr:carbohydrate ABC transporter permease [Saccharothrix coeruleofusca]MBP2335937.1 multiple sugar transport system permease protein [Saccharothrix coeruleofusca]GGP76478.1 sugar ABC transporter permease [Saccharothrix coeruleofusca]